jgi:HD superfamily phosphohydrolase
LVRLRPQELAIVDHPAFQRLGEIYQLGQTHLVYRGATHKRLEHALGAVHVVQLMIDALARNAGPEPPDPDDTIGGWALDSALRAEEVIFCRLGALLHDMGHLPAGHTLEDELGLLRPHDATDRLDLILDRTAWFGSPYSPP